jgi:hypothetical protein
MQAKVAPPNFGLNENHFRQSKSTSQLKVDGDETMTILDLFERERIATSKIAGKKSMIAGWHTNLA